MPRVHIPCHLVQSRRCSPVHARRTCRQARSGRAGQRLKFTIRRAQKSTITTNMRIAVSVSATIPDSSGKRLLLSRRGTAKSTDPGLWETIGGKLEPGELPENCLKRELKEEIGCHCESKTLFGVYSMITPDHQLISIQYLVQLDREPAIQNDEIEELGWFDQSQAESLSYAANCEERVMDYFQRQRQR